MLTMLRWGIVRTDQACRAEFYRVKALVEAANTREEIDAVAAACPAWIVTA